VAFLPLLVLVVVAEGGALSVSHSCYGVRVNLDCSQRSKELTRWDHRWACCRGPRPRGPGLLYGRASSSARAPENRSHRGLLE
jgi:hypothetical protein